MSSERMLALILLPAVLALATAGCGRPAASAGEPPTGADRRAALARACRWAPAFGGVPSDQLVGYDLVVVDVVAAADGAVDTDEAAIAGLQRSGSLVLAYLSVGTVERWRHYARAVPDSWTLGAVEGWAGERYVDARQPGWQDLMVREALTLAAAGVDGLYLDNLDVAEDHPDTAAGMVALVRRLRAVAPDLLLIGQNGLAIAERLPLDALAHEDVFWRYDDGYRASTPAERQALVPRLRGLRDRGLPVFTVEYAPPGSGGAADALAAALAEGFRPAVTVLDLDQPPHATPSACPAG